MRRKILSITNGAAVVLLASACAPRSSADRADTSTLATETVATTSRVTTAPASSATVVDTAPTLPAPDLKSEISVIQPITCRPATFGSGDTLTLQMGTPHGDYLSIHSPDRTVYSLVYPLLGKMRRNYSIIPSEEFKKIGTFPIPGSVRAIAQVKGRDTILEPVFTEPGKYMIVMGENLASDYDNRSSDCTVIFLSRSKQQIAK